MLRKASHKYLYTKSQWVDGKTKNFTRTSHDPFKLKDKLDKLNIQLTGAESAKLKEFQEEFLDKSEENFRNSFLTLQKHDHGRLEKLLETLQKEDL